MKWLLIMLAFSGPTSTDYIKYKWYNSETECEEAFKDQYKKSSWNGRVYDTHICIPFEKEKQ